MYNVLASSALIKGSGPPFVDVAAETDRIRERALHRLEALCLHLLPNGRKKGCRWVAGDVDGGPGRSFDVNLRTGVFGDWAAGEPMREGGISLWMAVRGVPFEEARAQLAAWLGMPLGQAPARGPVKAKPVGVKREKAVFFPPGMEPPTPEDLVQLSRARGIDATPLALAADRGFVRCYDDALNGRCWLYTDQRRRCGLRRRLDNQPFLLKNGTLVKCAACPGWDMSAPLGVDEAKDYPCFGLVEGGPDGLSVLGQAWASALENRVAPVVMPSASSHFPDADLDALRGKVGRVFADHDGPGWTAARRWLAQLAGAGIEADAYSFAGLTQSNGRPVKDLNEFCNLDDESWGWAFLKG